jgi:hypothetical protein
MGTRVGAYEIGGCELMLHFSRKRPRALAPNQGMTRKRLLEVSAALATAEAEEQERLAAMEEA